MDIFLTKVLVDSDYFKYFEDFFRNQNKNSLDNLRTKLFDLYHNHTAIKGDFEPPRIFNKIINILAFKRKLKGAVRGTISQFTLPIDEIRYNRLNWRDISKDKAMTRNEFLEKFPEQVTSNGFYKYSIQKAKGFVTIATVRISSSLATSAIIGAAPVPVPPPIPAVMNSMSVSSKTCLIFSLDSNAASLPLSGSAPAPRPFVALSPRCIFIPAFESSKS